MGENQKISTESYKGVRDFYPENLFVQKFIFKKWREVVESFGYVQYDASILESAELYRAKSGEEIVNEQTYTFKDRGDREVTLRPEMTPTVARMVAAKERELVFPLRWYSIPNLFRYEKPQRGRLREHWQLNVDLFGSTGQEADAEIIMIAHEIMKKFGAKEEDFVIRINNRKIINSLYEKFSLNDSDSYKVSKIIDKKDKISKDAFKEALLEILKEKTDEFITLLSSNEKLLEYIGPENEATLGIINLIERLESQGVTNVIFDATLMRGFDYYTGMVFEVFDIHPDNNRSVFGGGRYDDLLDIFGARKVPAVGFGAGDVTARDFLETHNLLPEYRSSTDIYVCILAESPEAKKYAHSIVAEMRNNGIKVAVDITDKKLGDKIKIADKQKIPYLLVIGEKEKETGKLTIKNLLSGEEKSGSVSEISGFIER